MSFLLPPATAPDSSPADTTLPSEPPVSSPVNDEITPPPALVAPIIQVPLPSLSPPQQSTPVAPLASPALPPVVVGTSPPPNPVPTTPTLSPISSQPQPQPQPQPPTTSPTPVTATTPPPQNTTPDVSPPDNTPVTATPASPSTSTTPTIPTSPSLPLVSPGPPVRQTKTGPTTIPNPTSRPKAHIPSSAHAKATKQHTPFPAASAVIPSPPPVSLPVPQTPSGGAWFPDTSVPPSILPSIPGTPGGADSPTAPVVTNSNGSLPSSSSSLPSSGADHQNVEAAVPSSGGSNGSSVFVVGLVVGGALLLVLAAVFGILVIFCRKRQKKSGDFGSGKMHGSSFSGYEDKSSLPLYTKPDPNITGYQVSVNASKPHGLSTDTSGTALLARVSPGAGINLSSGTFSYEELAAATSGFSQQNMLGQGGFGYVYKGVLPNGKVVAVKQLKMGGDQGEREFRAEVDTISQVHHKHLVSLVGYCISGSERLLVYEFVPNNTLDFHLHGKGQPVLDWPTRLKIAIGSAKGLAYLHEDCSPTIIHRDIKASNILLDDNFEAKVSDFGLAKIFCGTNNSVTHITTRVVGTFGYLAPEYASSGKVTDKSDVYSYGVVLLELITGHPPISNFGSASSANIVNWARPLLAQAIASGNFDTLADPRLQNNYNVDEMANMVSCAAACVRLSSWRRPRLSQVIRALEGNLSPSELDDGTRPGDSSMHFPYESLDFDARNYMEDLKKMALASKDSGYTSRYSDKTSEFGLNLSVSCSDTSHQIL